MNIHEKESAQKDIADPSSIQRETQTRVTDSHELQSSLMQEGRFSSDDIHRLLSSLALESKAITLAAMGSAASDTIFTSRKLATSVSHLQGSVPEWKMARNSVWGYCENVFEDVGLVAQKVIDQWHNTYGYILTDYGRTIGLSFAGHLLRFSLEHPDYSLGQIFGFSATSTIEDKDDSNNDKKRAQATRLNLLRYFATKQVADTFNDKNIIDNNPVLQVTTATLESHLKLLSRNNIIDRRTVTNQNVPVVTFALPKEKSQHNPNAVRGLKTLTQQVYEVLLEFGANTLYHKQISELLHKRTGKQYPHFDISRVLSGLAAQGFIVRAGVFDFTKNTAITIDPQQHKLITEIVTLVDQFQRGEQTFIQEGCQKLQSLTVEEIKLLMKKARKNSPNANESSKDDLKSAVIATISDQPLKTREITVLLKERDPRFPNEMRILQILNELRQQGEIKSKPSPEGTGFVWLVTKD